MGSRTNFMKTSSKSQTGSLKFATIPYVSVKDYTIVVSLLTKSEEVLTSPGSDVTM